MPLWLTILTVVILVNIVLMVIIDGGYPVRSLAWILVLVFLPVLGILFYLFFGRSHKKDFMLEDVETERLKARVQDAAGASFCSEPPSSQRNLVTLLHKIGNAPPVGGNDVRVYTHIDPLLEDLVADLQTARHHIHFQFFIFDDDEYGRKVGEILARKAEAGVEVRLMMDGMINITRRAYFRHLAKRGVQVRPFRRIGYVLPSDANNRNHRKNVIIDGRIGYTGGMNIARRYAVGLYRKHWHGIWRDTHLRVTGPVVAEMQSAFLMDWKFSSRQLLDDPVYFPMLAPSGDLLMQMVASDPMGENREILQGMLRMISGSRRYLYIQAPYFIPGEPLSSALRDAALSGVDVRLMIPDRPDRPALAFVHWAAWSYLQSMLDAGVKVCFYEKGFLHAKMILADDEVVTIGSSNLDVRSFDQSYELNTFIYDPAFAGRMRELFEQDEQDGHYVTPEAWAARSGFLRFRDAAARLLSPLL